MKSLAAALLISTLFSPFGAAFAQDASASADPAAGEALFGDACAQCHGRTGRGMASFPSLQKLSAETVTERLEAYRAGETVGPNSGLMKSVASNLTDEEIVNLAAFISQNFK